jgi:uncharacterized protein YkwD
MILMLCTIPIFSSALSLRAAALLFVTVSTLASLLLFQPSYVAAFSGCTAEPAPVVNGEFEAQVAQLVNVERAKNNLPPLKLLSSLTAAARYHAMDMAVDNSAANSRLYAARLTASAYGTRDGTARRRTSPRALTALNR